MAPTLLTPQECWGWAAGPMTPHVPEVPWPQPWPADTPQNSMLVMGLLMLLAAAQDSEGREVRVRIQLPWGAPSIPVWL